MIETGHSIFKPNFVTDSQKFKRIVVWLFVDLNRNISHAVERVGFAPTLEGLLYLFDEIFADKTLVERLPDFQELNQNIFFVAIRNRFQKAIDFSNIKNQRLQFRFFGARI